MNMQLGKKKDIVHTSTEDIKLRSEKGSETEM